MTPAERTREWRRENPEKARATKQRWRLRNADKVKSERERQNVRNRGARLDKNHVRRYGITLEERNEILRAQGGKCAICEAPEPGGKGDWHTDHCHRTKTIRGVLCAGCNLIAGHIEANPERFRRILEYLKKHTEPQSDGRRDERTQIEYDCPQYEDSDFPADKFQRGYET